MGHRNLQECVRDLERAGQLRRINVEIDPYLEAAEIHRRIYRAGGPALLFTRVKGCTFPVVCNLFGTRERMRYIFRDTLDAVRQLVELKKDPSALAKKPWSFRKMPKTLWNLRPKFVRRGPIFEGQTTIRQLPQIVSWPKDGGAFITLPQVYTEDAERPGWRHSNLGMYRIQLSGNEYQPDREVGLHYQIHRGIGWHHAAAIRNKVPFRVTIAVGGPPAMTLAAVMPLPEGFPELAFAGALAGHRIRMIPSPPAPSPAAAGEGESVSPLPQRGRGAGGEGSGSPLFADADFCITGTVDPDRLLPEGPFGDHLGYYSLAHPFPVLKVEHVYHRKDAIWPMTVVGRPPQEDTSFGDIIHEITGPIIPTVIAGVHAIHAVDAAGVHPLLLAIGSERYVPFASERKPQELLTIANAILGQGQLSLAKYLLIVAKEDDPNLEIHDIPAFFQHLLSRIDWRTDLHFQTCTTIDTLDYSGTALNEGSKVVFAAAGKPGRTLGVSLPAALPLPNGFHSPEICLPGIIAIQGQSAKNKNANEIESEMQTFAQSLGPRQSFDSFPLIVVVDDSEFTAKTLGNFLWVTFTRSNPAADIFGGGGFTRQKHWGCEGPLVIDARIKPHHAPPLEPDTAVAKRVDSLAASGGPLHGII
ncbi:MAG TPA: UbiD family decarboxylase [Gemmataceae bacterium]|jgi:4-hydroxy-3-polyprenylbenzoate decarboxylase|nr:UbiD family decarboxylase [Gemmataceae bacterium]